MKPKLVILESSDIAASYMGTAALDLGYDPVFFCSMKNYQGDTKTQITKFDYRDITGHEPSKIITLIKNLEYNVAGVISLVDSVLHVVSELALTLDCPGPDSAIIKLKDKGYVATIVPEYSPKTLLFSRDSSNIKQLELFLMSCPNGIVLKPRFGSGAMGFFRLKTVDEFVSVLENVKKIRISESLHPDLWVAQEAIDGKLASCEGYVVCGTPHFLGFTGSSKIGNTQSQSFFPYDLQLSALERELAYSAIKILVERSEYQKGYFHVEFLFAGENTKLIDANIGRLGGGAIGDHISMSAGINPIELYRHFIEVSLFNRESFQMNSSQMKLLTKSFLYGAPQAAKLKMLEMAPQKICRHTQILDNDSNVPAMGLDNWAWIGILTGPDGVLEKEFSSIKLITDQGVMTPVC